MKSLEEIKKQHPVLKTDKGVWYVETSLQKYLQREQAENLPPIKNMGTFVFVGDNKENDIVLINDKQEVVKTYNYSREGYDQMTAFINIIKISLHYAQHEQI